MSCVNDAPCTILFADLDHFFPRQKNSWVGDDGVNYNDDLASVLPWKRTDMFFEISKNFGMRGWKEYSERAQSGLWGYIGDVLHSFTDCSV